jgi:hypothetical protein
LIELFSFIVLAGFFILCLRNYKLNKNENTLKLGIGFLLIAVAEIALIFTKFVIYYPTLITKNINGLMVMYQVIQGNYIISQTSLFLHKFFTLLGLYIVYKINLKKWRSIDFFIGVYFVLVSALLGLHSECIFHITAIILLGLIILNYKKVYKKNKFENTKILITIFSILIISQIFLMLPLEFFYIMGQIFQLAVYILLLWLIIKINYGKKTKSQ